MAHKPAPSRHRAQVATSAMGVLLAARSFSSQLAWPPAAAWVPRDVRAEDSHVERRREGVKADDGGRYARPHRQVLGAVARGDLGVVGR
eukprot:5690844-Prymnesium_polylepis.2